MTPTPEQTVIEVRTLADRLSEGRIPMPEALRYATLLGEALRKVHGSGKAHGAVAPESVVLAGAGIDLTPPLEKLERHEASVSIDIFGFGAVLYEMLTSRKVLSGGATPVPEPTGIPAADRLIAWCLAKEPAARPQSMQKVLLELKLVSMVTRRAEARLRAEMQQFEVRLAARLEEHEKSVAERTQTASDALNKLTPELDTLKAGLVAALQGVEANAARFTALERSIDTVEVKLAEEIHMLEKGSQAQAAIIESVRADVAQTDNLVEGLVEAMEMIQDSILDPESTRS